MKQQFLKVYSLQWADECKQSINGILDERINNGTFV